MTAGRHVGLAVAAVIATLLTLAAAPAGVALAAAPELKIEQPAAGSFTKAQTPSFAGTTNDIDILNPVTLAVYEDSGKEGELKLVGTSSMLLLPLQEAWEGVPESPLKPGLYTAVAEQSNTLSELGVSKSVSFTVDTTAPVVGMNKVASPSNNQTPTLSGAAGKLEGDDPTVEVTICQGSSVCASKAVPVSGSEWSYTPPSLADGTYTAHATQADAAGNVDESVSVTFVVDATPPAIAITTPANEALLDQTRPTFSGVGGTASGDHASVTLKIYTGALASGSPSQELVLPIEGGKWTSGSTGPQLPNGIHTAVAEQSDEAGNVAKSTSTFTIATNSPTVTLATSGLVVRAKLGMTTATPSFSGSAGTAPEDGTSVTVNIFSGTSASGSPERRVSGAVSGSTWTVGPVEALEDGTYTAQAEQSDSSFGGHPGVSEPSTFVVDGDAPQVTQTSPTNGSSTSSSSQTVSGAAGKAPGDLPTITIQLFAGSTVTAGATLEAVTVQAASGAWSGAFGGLTPGTYTARAQQRDDVGNTGFSAPATFTVTLPPAQTPPAPAPPVASFRWFPSAPHVGEPVSLVSTSTAASNPLAGFAWSLSASGPLEPGSSVRATSFSTPGSHVVRLSVIDGNGLSSMVAESVPVTAPALVLMQPFPVVRIAGTESSAGVRISLFTVQAPVGAKISVSCHGPGCPAKPRSLVASAGRGRSRAGMILISLRRFERSLRPGAVLEIRVTKSGQIGKFTRFTVRRHKLPTRVDSCLGAAGVKPIACPSS